MEFLNYLESGSSTTAIATSLGGGDDDDGQEEGEGEEEEAPDRPTFALISTDHLGRKLLTSHSINLKSKSLEPGPISEKLLVDVGSEWVVPVGNYTATTNGYNSPSRSLSSNASQSRKEEGVLILGEESIHFVPRDLSSLPSSSKGKATAPIIPTSRNLSVPIPVGLITAWTRLSQVPSEEIGGEEEGREHRWLVGDIYGKMLFVELDRDEKGFVKELRVRDLGDVRFLSLYFYTLDMKSTF